VGGSIKHVFVWRRVCDGRLARRVNAPVTIRIGFQQMSKVTGAQQGYVKVDKTFA